jgi:hypothetical protein
METVVRKIEEPDVMKAIQDALAKMQGARNSLREALGIGHDWMMENEIGFLSSVRNSQTANEEKG